MASTRRPEEQRAAVTVGIRTGDIRGSDHRALQAAVEYVAGLGGGTVTIGPGRYLMRNALTLRDNVQVSGVPGRTILVACDGVEARLALDGDCNERQITLADPGGFRVGDGVAILDDRMGGGFGVTTATLLSQLDPATFRISAPLYLDYMVSLKARARLVFPVIGGWRIRDAAVQGLTIDGNRAKALRLDGCRGGGIYLFECQNVAIRDCVVRDCSGDGIAFQVSDDVTVADCACEHNASLGLHPGSGSQRPVVRGNRSVGNGGDGLFVCWRVKHGLFEQNEISANKGYGISIGHKDTDNLFRGNAITGNGKAGVLFRDESEPMGAHRNVFEVNTILDNGAAETPRARAAIMVLGHTHDLVFRGNKIGSSKSGAHAGIVRGKHVRGLAVTGNQFLRVKHEVIAGR
ncbi:MAG: right-handed parallel beta-helix repeat-containing protein [Planctomycetota bacterium]|nr:right-handed parallel beta-helix repeat-containing protein [Planctomycetota bacterium]